MIKPMVAALLGLSVVAGFVAPVLAQNAREAELVGFHQLCNRGDRKACVRFGMMLQQNADRHAVWRSTHPEFFFFER